MPDSTKQEVVIVLRFTLRYYMCFLVFWLSRLLMLPVDEEQAVRVLLQYVRYRVGRGPWRRLRVD